MIKQICILTKSYKNGGYCVAGIDLNTKNWVRLVSSEDSKNEIPCYYMNKKDNDIDVLDVIEVNLLKNIVNGCQRENYLIDIGIPLKTIGKMSIEEVVSLKGYDCPDLIFGNKGKALPANEAALFNYSIILVQVTDINFFMERSLLNGEWLKKEINFTYKNNQYTLVVTDPKYKKTEYNNKYFESASIVVSIPADEYNGWHHKFVASIFI